MPVHVVTQGLGWMPWKPALALAAILAVVWLSLRGFARTRVGAQIASQLALMMALYALWQLAGSYGSPDPAVAVARGAWWASLEQHLAMPSEAWIQGPVLGHLWVMSTADIYYSAVHVPVFLIVLGWVLFMRRADWPFVRTTVVVLTGVCLVIQYIAVAPPRLVPGLGVVDTGKLDHHSVYEVIAGANQYAAMPSVHVAWAAAVALIIVVVARSPWRWLSLAYPLCTWWVVIVTGNHFIVDGLVAIALLAVSAGIACVIPSQRPVRWSRSGNAPPRADDAVSASPARGTA